MKKVLVFIIVVFIANTSLVAQKPLVSGYLGKMNYVGLRFNTGIRTDVPERATPYTVQKSNGSTILGTPVTFKSELELSVGHVFTDQISLEVQLGHNSTSMSMIPTNGFGQIGNDGAFQNYVQILGSPKIVDVYTGVGAKFFRRKKGALAPIGSYFGLKFNIHNYNVSLSGLGGEFYDNLTGQRTLHEIEYGDIKYKIFESTAMLGRKTAVTDDLILDIGLSFGFAFSGPNFFDNTINGYRDSFADEFLAVTQAYHIAKIYIGGAYMF